MRDVIAWSAMVCAPLVSACAETQSQAAAVWSGTVDMLASGQVVVRNPAEPLWPAESEWQVVEELRIGRIEGDGPDAFGRIRAFEVDAAGRIWVLEGQAQELRVFDPSGAHVRTIGRSGGGPGEFAQAVKVDLGPDGNIWVMDPRNARVSVFDTAGALEESKLALGGFVILPWPGGFDEQGRYYAPAPGARGPSRMGLVRYDSLHTPIDTLDVPEDPVAREFFVVRDDAGRPRITASAPYQGGLQWRLSRGGTIWAMVTDQYRLFELTAEGDTLRTITREFEPLPVTTEDLERVDEDMEWFTNQGGRIDRSKIPSTKPPIRGFFQDDERNLWVERTMPRAETGRLVDVFEAEGRYLGEVHSPFPLSLTPVPIVREGVLYGVTRDELDVPFIVRARIVKP